MDGAVLEAVEVCTIQGCEKPVRARGWCSTHYARWSRTGDPGPAASLARVAAEITPCTVEGCERPKRTSGAAFCEMHYYRIRRTGEAGPAELLIGRGPIEPCTLPDCDRPKHSRGLQYCFLHYERVRRTGTPDAPKLFIAALCPVEGCDRKVQELGMCKLHATRFRRHGNPNVFIPPSERDLACGERNVNWTGEDATYNGVHQRLRKQKGSAKKRPCFDCGSRARQWSYDHCDPDERVSEDGLPYSVNLDRYQTRCVPCHKAYDLAHIAHLVVVA